MARIIGIDLGARSAKVAVLRAGFRSAGVESVQTFEVLPGAGSAIERSLDAVFPKDGAAAMVAKGEGGAATTGASALGAGFGAVDATDAVGIGVPGDRVVLRLFDIPFSDPKKLAPVVANELADDMPWEVEDVVFDHAGLAPPLNKVMAAAVRSDEVGRLLERLRACGVDPRHVQVAPLSYGELVRRAGEAMAPAGETVAVVDIGHARTNVCFVRDGRALMGRTISRGGHQLTVALRSALQLSYEDAERLKEQHGVVSSHPEQLSPEQQRIAAILGQALMPLAREVRQTIAVLAAKLEGPRTGEGERRAAQPSRVLLCGGTSLLRGIDSVLANELNIATGRLSLGAMEETAEAGLSQEGELVGALALGIAFEGGRRGALELRQGEHAFKVDRSVFRDKLWTLAASAVAILICAALSAFASMSSLEKEEARLKKQLRAESRMIFGKSMRTATSVLKALKRMNKAGGGGGFTIPPNTAVDVLDMLSRDIPKEEGVTIDVTRLDIKSGKTYLKGTADSQTSVGKMVNALKANPCFKDVSTGKISTVSDGKKQFTVNLATKCF
ncbi:MAG: pilus assembly protein PilM [Myxococcales bacterium]|nr:pilus assembly protein PilM [Myxococcales bacterium]